ncbi:MAG: NAD(P)-dependent glycerol-3-phosphate dehydrogenase [Alphaproteobacteria bacterium]|nr:NAD(P)-dependent glycerol-3-phosphate dehydrogenase [Alphaproteobacteria bacterium]
MNKISVLGAGAWGTALAKIVAKNVPSVSLWAREADLVQTINTTHVNQTYLPNVILPNNLVATNDLTQAITDAEAILLVIPAQFLRTTIEKVASIWPKNVPAVICCKGIEQKTGALMSEMLAEYMPKTPIAIISGPTFAEEAAMDKPTAVTLACADEELGKELVKSLGSHTFRPYYTNDLISVQIGGAVKNVMAIAAGIVAGKKLGDNAHAAMLTRGLAEISRLAVALGGSAQTLMGLAGMGDLLLTANSTQSRNYTVGLELGAGKSLAKILSDKKTVAEGVYTASAVLERAKQLNVEMPICESLSKIMNDNVSIDDVIENLFGRPFKKE